MYELLCKQTGDVVREELAYAPLEVNDPRWYEIRNSDTGVIWDGWYYEDPED